MMSHSKLERYVVGPLRYVFSTAVLVTSAPTYFLIWAGWRGVSLVFPSWIYQKGDDFLYSLYQRLVLFFFEYCTLLNVCFSGDFEEVIKKKENVLYIGNHQSTVDWLVCNMVAVRQGSIGHLRYVMKDTLQMLPYYGLYFYEHGCIYIKRGNFKQHRMEQALSYLSDKWISSWVVIFPEGTRFIPEQKGLIEKSRKVAEASGLPPLTHHLTPKPRGTYLCLSQLRGNIDAVYDVTVMYDGTINARGQRKMAPQLADFLRGKSPNLHINIKRIPVDEIPQDENAFKKWMYNRFITKDKIVKQYYDEAEKSLKLQLNKNGVSHRLPLSATAPSFLFFMGCFIPLYLSETWRWLYFRSILAAVPLGYAWLGFKAVC